MESGVWMKKKVLIKELYRYMYVLCEVGICNREFEVWSDLLIYMKRICLKSLFIIFIFVINFINNYYIILIIFYYYFRKDDNIFG